MERKWFLLVAFLLLWRNELVFAKPLIFLPFEYGTEWYVVHGNHGSVSHSHQPMYYAYDFDKGSDIVGEANPAFGALVVAPIPGQVVYIRDDLPDFDFNDYFGNEVIIEAQGIFVRIAHLRKGSIYVSVGDEIEIGDPIGKVGGSGSFPRPNLHVQVQKEIDGKSIPFRFVEDYVIQDRWYVSRNIRGASVLDNDLSRSVGNLFLWTDSKDKGSWSIWKDPKGGYTGENFLLSQDGAASFTWSFSTRESGVNFLFMRFKPSTGFDPNLFVDSLNGTHALHLTSVSPSDWYYVGQHYCESVVDGYSVTLRSATPGMTLAADALMAVKVPSFLEPFFSDLQLQTLDDWNDVVSNPNVLQELWYKSLPDEQTATSSIPHDYAESQPWIYSPAKMTETQDVQETTRNSGCSVSVGGCWSSIFLFAPFAALLLIRTKRREKR